MAINQIHEKLEVAASLEEVWDLISSPSKLKEITPDFLGFEITTPGLKGIFQYREVALEKQFGRP